MLRKFSSFQHLLLSSSFSRPSLARSLAASLSPDTISSSANKEGNNHSSAISSATSTHISLNDALDSKLEELQQQIDQLSSHSPAAQALDLKDLPISNAQLRNDFRIKQFVLAEQDDLIMAVRNPASLEDLFITLRSNEKRLYSNHLAAAFSAIFAVGRTATDRIQFVQSIVTSADFKRLCSLAIGKMRYMEPNEVLSLFKTLTFLSMNSRTLIMSGVLQMIRYQINEFQADELVLLDYLLSLQRKEKEEVGNVRFPINPV